MMGDETPMEPEVESLGNLYEKLTAEREPFLQRGLDAARLTVPHLLTETGTQGQDLPTPYQSTGARGVTSLSSKLLMALFPPSQPFFRFETNPFEFAALGEGVQTEVQKTLSLIERVVMSELEKDSLRPHLHEVLKQLVVPGNCLLHLGETETKVYKLNHYVVKRAPDGKVLKIIIKETISPLALLPEVRGIVMEGQNATKDTELDMYTGILLDESNPDLYNVRQEINKVTVPDSTGSYKSKDLPWLALRMEPLTGESYGYGYATSLLGDLKSLEGLWQALVEGAAAASKVLFLINPTGSTDAQELADAENGGFVNGTEEDVTTLKVDKGADLSTVFQAIGGIQDSLGFAFLLNTSVQRNGERVTAEEIRFLAQELEGILAGTYSLLSVELQLPLVKLVLKRLQRQGKIPQIPEESATPTVVTGLEALGRGHDLNRLDTFLGGAMQTFGPELIAQYVNVSGYLARRAAALSQDTDGLLLSEEEIQQRQQQAQLQHMAEKLGPTAIKASSDAVKAS